MSEQSVPTDDPSEINRPFCSVCGVEMWLRGIVKDAPGKELRLFECPVCQISEGRT